MHLAILYVQTRLYGSSWIVFINRQKQMKHPYANIRPLLLAPPPLSKAAIIAAIWKVCQPQQIKTFILVNTSEAN